MATEPQPPFPAVAWDERTRTVVLTAKTDWLPQATSAPGPKQIHLLLLGFRNPERPGRYPIRIEISPDPATSETWVGRGSVRILPRTRPSIEVLSTVNGSPPPPFPNPIYQQVRLGEELLTSGFYLWGRNGDPLVGAEVHRLTSRRGLIVDADGHRVGHVRIRAPRGASGFNLVTSGSAVSASAFLTGVPAALLTTRFVPDPSSPGRYAVTFSLHGGSRQTTFVDVGD